MLRFWRRSSMLLLFLVLFGKIILTFYSAIIFGITIAAERVMQHQLVVILSASLCFVQLLRMYFPGRSPLLKVRCSVDNGHWTVSGERPSIDTYHPVMRDPIDRSTPDRSIDSNCDQFIEFISHGLILNLPFQPRHILIADRIHLRQTDRIHPRDGSDPLTDRIRSTYGTDRNHPRDGPDPLTDRIRSTHLTDRIHSRIGSDPRQRWDARSTPGLCACGQCPRPTLAGRHCRVDSCGRIATAAGSRAAPWAAVPL